MSVKLLELLCLLVVLLVYVEAYTDINPGHIQSRIVSGTPAALGQFPWQVIIKLDPVEDLLCGASIIGPTWVLTAAHCTYKQQSLFLIFGTITFDNPNAVNMTSTQFFEHPNYNPQNLNNDVSVIQLPTALSFSTSIQPIQLVTSSYAKYNFIGQVAIIAGFGLTDDYNLDFSNSLLYAYVDIINNNECTAVYGASVVFSSTLCAKGENGTNMSICSGDSGGPLVTQGLNGGWMQIGINSFVAEDMCTEGYPSGYARLTSFLDFISQTTGIPFNGV